MPNILIFAVAAGKHHPTIVASLQCAFEQIKEHLQGLIRQKLRDSSYRELAEGMSMISKYPWIEVKWALLSQVHDHCIGRDGYE